MTYQQPLYPRSRRNRHGTVAALVVATLILTCCGLSVLGSVLWNTADTSSGRPNPNIDNPPLTGQETQKTVTYQVTGDGTASTISYTSDLAGSITQIRDVTLPWSTDVVMDSHVGIATMTVQRDDTVGSVTCAILVNQKQVKTSTSYGPHAVVSCSETVEA